MWVRECTSVHARSVRACMYEKALRCDGLPEDRHIRRSRRSVLALSLLRVRSWNRRPQSPCRPCCSCPAPVHLDVHLGAVSSTVGRQSFPSQTIPTNVRWRQASATPTTRTDTESKCKHRLASSQITLPIAPATRQPPPRTSATTMEAPARA